MVVDVVKLFRILISVLIWFLCWMVFIFKKVNFECIVKMRIVFIRMKKMLVFIDVVFICFFYFFVGLDYI